MPRLQSCLWVPVAAAALLLGAACEDIQPPSKPDSAGSGPQIQIVPADGADGWKPGKPLQVTVDGGRLAHVSVRNADEGEPVEGELDRDGGTWTPRWALRTDTEYRVHAEAAGGRESERRTFTTLDPASTVRIASVNANKGTYGVGLPVIVEFTDPIENKKAVQRAMELRTSEPVTGAWHWMNDEEVHFRPKDYWPSGTKVHLIAHLNGVRTGAGTYGNDNTWVKFDIGDKHVTRVDTDAHTMTVKSGGEVVKTFPISAGDPKHRSSSGTFAAAATEQYVRMDSESYGVPVDAPDGYSLDSYWNVRYTFSGQFVHSAPWSAGAQGERNVSHGCINTRKAHAKWFYNFTNVGDIIEVTGSGRKVEWGNGWTDWEKSFDEYVDGSATGAPVHTLTMSGEPRNPETPGAAEPAVEP